MAKKAKSRKKYVHVKGYQVKPHKRHKPKK